MRQIIDVYACFLTEVLKRSNCYVNRELLKRSHYVYDHEGD